MAIYRARWIAPATGKPMFREFHTKPEAEAFRALPRDHFVWLERCKEPDLTR
jgi:hypothetical protein